MPNNQRQRLVKLDDGLIVRTEGPDALDEHLHNEIKATHANGEGHVRRHAKTGESACEICSINPR